MPIDDPSQTLEDRVQAESFMHRHGMHYEPDSEAYDSGPYACTSCQSAKVRCLVPVLAHISHKRFRAHSCLRCRERGGCSLTGTIMSETATGGISLEKPDANGGVGTPMIQVGSARGHVSHGRSTTTMTTSTTTSALAAHSDSDKPVPRLRRMQPKQPPRSRGATPAPTKSSHGKSPNPSRAGSPGVHLPTPSHSSPSHTGSSEGAVSALVSSSPPLLTFVGSSPPPSTTPLPSFGDRVLANALAPAPALSVGDGLITKLQAKHETNCKNGSPTDLGPPPGPPTALASFASSIHITKRRRLSSLALGPRLSTTISALPASEGYAAAVAAARAEMHAAETVHEGAVATLATAQHTSALALAAAARIEAEVARIEEEQQAALAHAAACAKALEGLSGEVTTKQREREEAAVVVSSAQERVTVVATQLEERVETYHRVVRGFVVEQP